MEKRKRVIPLNLQLFSEPAPEPTPEPTLEPPKTFTQEDLDKIVADRIARERKKFGDYDETKAKLAEYEKEREEAEKAKLSEIERANKEREEALKKAQELEEKFTKAQETHKQSVITAEFRMLAKEAGAQNVASALKLADLAGVEIGEDGAVKGVAEAIEALKTSDPYLFAKPAEPKPIGDSGIPPKQSDKTAEQLLKEAFDKARTSGLESDRVAYAELKQQLKK